MKKLFVLITVIFISTGLFARESSADTVAFSRGMGLKDLPVFMPKGYTVIGASIAYHNYGLSKYKLAILDNMTADAYLLKASPFFYYFVADNHAIGARLAYNRISANVGNISLNLGDALQFGIEDFQYLQHKFSGALAYRYYLQLGQTKRFGLFADFNLEVGYGQGVTKNGATKNPESYTGNYTEVWDFGFGVNPGLCIFFTEFAALEVSLGVVGLNYTLNKQTTNQIENVASYRNFDGNFSLDFLSIAIGIDIVIPSKTKK